MLYKFSHPIAKLLSDLLDSHVSVLNSVVQDGRSQQFLVIGNGGHDSGSFHRMNDVRVTFSTTLGTLMGFDGKFHGLVEECGFQWVVHGSYIILIFLACS